MSVIYVGHSGRVVRVGWKGSRTEERRRLFWLKNEGPN